MQKGDSAIRNVSVILAVTSKIVDYKSKKLSKSLTLDIQVLLKEYPPGYLKGVVLAKNQDAEKITANATGRVLNAESNASV